MAAQVTPSQIVVIERSSSNNNNSQSGANIGRTESKLGKMRSISAICRRANRSAGWSAALGIRFLLASSLALSLLVKAPACSVQLAQQQWHPPDRNNGPPSDMPLLRNGSSFGQPVANIGAQAQAEARAQNQDQERLPAEQKPAEPSASEVGQPDAEGSSSADARLARFIETRLVPAEPSERKLAERRRIETLADELGKVFRVLQFAGRLAHRLQGTAQPDAMEAAASGPEPAVRSLSAEPEVPLRAALSSGLVETLRRHSGRMLVNRLAKKTDWNALFVKLAKVFLQYFLDLILNDMFGTTGEYSSRAMRLCSVCRLTNHFAGSSRSISNEIDARKTLRDFLRAASGLSGS